MKDCLFIPDMNPPICKTKHLTLIASCVPFPGFISFLSLRGIWVYFHGLLYTFSSFCMCMFLQHIILFLNHYRDVHLFFCSLINVLLGTLIYTDSVSPAFLFSLLCIPCIIVPSCIYPWTLRLFLIFCCYARWCNECS